MRRRIVLTSGARSRPRSRPASIGSMRGQPLGAWLADQAREHHRHHQRAQPVEGGPSRGIDRAAASSRPVAASAGRMSNAPASGSEAPSQITGGASVIAPARAA